MFKLLNNVSNFNFLYKQNLKMKQIMTNTTKQSNFIFKKFKIFNFNTSNGNSTKKNEVQKKIGLNINNENINGNRINNDSNKYSNSKIITDEYDLDDLDSITDKLKQNNIISKDATKKYNSTQFVNSNNQVYNFNSIASNYLTRVVNAFIEIMNENKSVDIEVKEEENTIIVNVQKIGNYIIKKDAEQQLISLQSPISGLFKYKFDFDNEHWIDEKDGHIMDELLTREFCKHSKGLLIIK